MRIYLCGVLVLAMMPMTASARDLVGGGLKVASVERVDDSRAVIRLDNGKGGVDSLWVDCLAAEWGYEGVEAGGFGGAGPEVPGDCLSCLSGSTQQGLAASGARDLAGGGSAQVSQCRSLLRVNVY